LSIVFCAGFFDEGVDFAAVEEDTAIDSERRHWAAWGVEGRKMRIKRR